MGQLLWSAVASLLLAACGGAVQLPAVPAPVPAACTASIAAALASRPAGLRVVPRWSFEGPVSDGGGGFFLPAEDQLLVLDAHTGQLRTRVPRLDGSNYGWLDRDFSAEVNAQAGKIVLRTTQPGCAFGLSVLD